MSLPLPVRWNGACGCSRCISASIDVDCGEGSSADPARIGVLLVLRLHRRETSSSIGVSRGIAARASASSCGSRTCWASSAATGAGHERVSSVSAHRRLVQREIGRDRRDPARRHRRADPERGVEPSRAGFARAPARHRRTRIDVFVDEALPRERAGEIQITACGSLSAGRAILRGPGEELSRARVAHDARRHEPAQQGGSTRGRQRAGQA